MEREKKQLERLNKMKEGLDGLLTRHAKVRWSIVELEFCLTKSSFGRAYAPNMGFKNENKISKVPRIVKIT